MPLILLLPPQKCYENQAFFSPPPQYRTKRARPEAVSKNNMKSLLTWPNESQPPQHSTRVHVNVNGSAGGAPAGGGTAVDSQDSQPAAGQQTTPRTPRKSKSMGRIHGGGGIGVASGTEVGGGGGGGGEGAGGSTYSHHNVNQHQEGHPEQQPQHQQPSTSATVVAPTHTEAPSTSNWHRGHRRVPSDGVAWRVSKGIHGNKTLTNTLHTIIYIHTPYSRYLASGI
ncbi:hypothetical protein SK128_021844 [Halocaridina rubra]|uniref:Uncharacterized protein n=1 Tax=Halocaridina rubra TaxID=373956 RepID=A0AAN8XCT3_HALRR